MEDEREGTGGMGKVEVLGRANHERWFRQMKYKMDAKEAFFTVEQTEENYALVVGMASASQIDPNEKKEPQWDNTRRAYWRKKHALVLWMFNASLSADDETLLDSCVTAKKVWEALKFKYQRVSMAMFHEYTNEIAVFNTSEHDSLEKAWTKLKELRRHIIAAKPSTKLQYDDEGLYGIFTRKLPAHLRYTMNTMETQIGLTVDEKIQFLVLEEEREKIYTGDAGAGKEEAANAAYMRNFDR